MERMGWEGFRELALVFAKLGLGSLVASWSLQGVKTQDSRHDKEA